ncbi:MAG: ATP-binding protein [Thermoanaerobaculia bacterium]
MSLGGGAGRARACSCRERDAVARLLEAAGIPPRYRHCRLSNFQVSSASASMRDQLTQARTIAQQYAEGFLLEGGRFRESGLLLFGPPGAGKTHLAVGVLVDVVERYRVHARFAEFTSLIHQIQATFDPGSPESKREILDPLVGAELLVLDELGSQQPTPWVRDILYLIINHRYTHRLPTLFTTNYLLDAGPVRSLKPKQVSPLGLDRGRDAEVLPIPAEEKLLASRLPAMLVSRLYEMAQPVALSSAEDFRRENKVHGAYQR